MSENSQLADASSDDEEDTRPIAATLTKNAKVKKAPKGLPCTPFFVSLVSFEAFSFAHTAKRQKWVYEPVTESSFSSRYWDVPVARTEINRMYP
jgi:hypothetical protein